MLVLIIAYTIISNKVISLRFGSIFLITMKNDANDISMTPVLITLLEKLLSWKNMSKIKKESIYRGMKIVVIVNIGWRL